MSGNRRTWTSAGRPEDREGVTNPLSHVTSLSYPTHSIPSHPSTCHVDSPQTYCSCRSYPIHLARRPTINFALYFARPASLCARAPAPMQPRQDLAEVCPPHPRPLYFFRSLLTPFAADLVQDLYLKELKSYKAPPAVSQPRMCILVPADPHVCG